jgi:Zinc carboxypeptidase
MQVRICAVVFICFFSISCIAQQSAKHPSVYFTEVPGSQFTPQHELNAYFAHLAGACSSTMSIEKYGQTYEKRPLQVAIFSSPENMARLESIRTDHLKRSGLMAGEPQDTKKIAIVWLSMSVHGNEPSGTECSPELAYTLALQTDPKIRQWLQNTVVIIDPSLNPDGNSRYTNWYRTVSTKHRNTNRLAREHNEPWPGGRSNHYQFDLNRDWAWATQVETATRLELYHKWYPHIHADLHEQYVDNPYYFPPAAEPMHALITPFQRQFQEVVGKNHAGYFDQNKWAYFTREWFDLFYPSYGDTYPMFNGSIGMTYEQAGHSTAGRVITIATGDTLSLYDRILHHRTTSLSTIEVASTNAIQLSDEMAAYFKKAKTQPIGTTKSYVIPAAQSREKVRALLQLLDKHRIKYGQVGAAMSGSGRSYRTGKETNIKIEADDIVIPAQQAQGNLLSVLFEAESDLADSVTYDITAWALPYAYGLEAYSLRQMITPNGRPGFTTLTPTKLAQSAYAWVIDRGSMSQLKAAGKLLQAGIKIRYANKKFELQGKEYAQGSFVIMQSDNRGITSNLDSTVQAAVAVAGIMDCVPIYQSWSTSGPNFGSENMVLIDAPSVALVFGDQVDANAYGHIWYYFEQMLDYPFTDISLDQISPYALEQFNTLIFVEGAYTTNDLKLKTISDWVKAGGRLITFDGATKSFAGTDEFKWEAVKPIDVPKDTLQEGRYFSAERTNISNSLSGAIIETRFDQGNPIGAGLGSTYFSLKTNANFYQSDSSSVSTPLLIPDNGGTYGFIGSNMRPLMAKSASVKVQKMEKGKAIMFADSPIFRCFWYNGCVLFGNALFF